MWRAIMSSRFASWVVGRVSIPQARQQQQELDLQRIYILTRLHQAFAQGKSARMPMLLHESQSLEPSTIRREVEDALQFQVLGIAEALHDILKQVGDPTPAASALTAAHQRLQRRIQRNSSGLSKLIRRLTRSNTGPPSIPASTSSASSMSMSSRLPGQAATTTSVTGATAGAASGAVSGSSATGDGSRGGAAIRLKMAAGASSGDSSSHLDSAASESTAWAGGCGGRVGVEVEVPLSGAHVALELQRRIGFRLELGPSSVPHPEAGTGVFLHGEVRAGTVVAIFPGVLYGRTQLSHMPNYPKVDTDNPYLSCRYDQSIVDSKPWGRGDQRGTAVPAVGASDAAASASAAGSVHLSWSSDHGSQDISGAFSSSSDTDKGDSCGTGSSRNRSGSSSFVEVGDRSSSSSSNPGDERVLELLTTRGRQSQPSTSSSSPWWVWSGLLSCAMEYLEGRHPLALGHFVNHPGAGQSPNVLEVSLDIPLDAPSLSSRPWLRAYMPVVQPPLHYDPYANESDEEDDEEGDEEGELKDDGARGHTQVHTQMVHSHPSSTAGTGAAEAAVGETTVLHAWRPSSPGALRPESLLTPPGGVVRLLVLVATRGMRDGEELLQNYRMNPHHVARPDWYVVHDAEAEERRWAKFRAMNSGAKSRGIRDNGGGSDGDSKAGGPGGSVAG